MNDIHALFKQLHACTLYCALMASLPFQGQARGYGQITLFVCRPHGANTSNMYNSLMAQYFLELFSAYENLVYL